MCTEVYLLASCVPLRAVVPSLLTNSLKLLSEGNKNSIREVRDRDSAQSKSPKTKISKNLHCCWCQKNSGSGQSSLRCHLHRCGWRLHSSAASPQCPSSSWKTNTTWEEIYMWIKKWGVNLSKLHCSCLLGVYFSPTQTDILKWECKGVHSSFCTVSHSIWGLSMWLHTHTSSQSRAHCWRMPSMSSLMPEIHPKTLVPCPDMSHGEINSWQHSHTYNTALWRHAEAGGRCQMCRCVRVSTWRID